MHRNGRYNKENDILIFMAMVPNPLIVTNFETSDSVTSPNYSNQIKMKI